MILTVQNNFGPIEGQGKSLLSNICTIVIIERFFFLHNLPFFIIIIQLFATTKDTNMSIANRAFLNFVERQELLKSYNNNVVIKI